MATDNINRLQLTDKDINYFWTKVDKSTGYGPWGTCWKWKTGNRRPKMKAGIQPGKIQFRKVQVGAHVASYRIAYNKWPELYVLHGCDIKNCVNPDHLREGTAAENAEDARVRNRLRRGSNHGMAKTTEEAVREIRSLGGLLSRRQLAIKFNLSRSEIAHILRGENWTHI